MSTLGRIAEIVRGFGRHPTRAAGYLRGLPEALRAAELCDAWTAGRDDPSEGPAATAAAAGNPLASYFDAHRTGRGIWKWTHYFDIYHRHLAKFIGSPAHVVEVGVYSGGSLQMWRHYFGPLCRMYGVDIEPACRAYEDEHTTMAIGDQADPDFWASFAAKVPAVDVLIDDGGHEPEQQMVTLESMLPHLRRGGVYICEDIHGAANRFAAYACGLAQRLNTAATAVGDTDLAMTPEPFQRAIHSVHCYPYMVVIEKSDVPVERFAAPRHGTEWQPFL